MTSPELIQFINEQKAKGLQLESYLPLLLAQGWKNEDIIKAEHSILTGNAIPTTQSNDKRLISYIVPVIIALGSGFLIYKHIVFTNENAAYGYYFWSYLLWPTSAAVYFVLEWIVVILSIASLVIQKKIIYRTLNYIIIFIALIFILNIISKIFSFSGGFLDRLIFRIFG